MKKMDTTKCKNINKNLAWLFIRAKTATRFSSSELGVNLT